MPLRSLRIRHFRNLGAQELQVPPQGVAIVGENAHGKTNLLEAVYYLETFRSFRGARDEQLVAFGREAFHVSAETDATDAEPTATEVAAGYQKGAGKRVRVDGVEPERIGDALGRMCVVVFWPGDVGVVSDGPAARRRFLDVVLSLNVPGYLASLQRFRHALAQRNALLRDRGTRAQVRAWDEPLVTAGAAVTACRAAWLERWSATFTEIHDAVSGGQTAKVVYEPAVPIAEGEGGEAGVAEDYRAALAGSRGREERQCATVVGPHRDEVRFEVEDGARMVDLRRYGSGGQRRTAAFALRMIEAHTVRSVRGRDPLILLDDVFAELDAERSARVLELLDGDHLGQVLLTAPKESDVRLRRDVLPRWRIRDGRISA